MLNKLHTNIYQFLLMIFVFQYNYPQTLWKPSGVENKLLFHIASNAKGELIASTQTDIYYSNDGGLNWDTIPPPQNIISFLRFDDSSNIYVGDTDGMERSLVKSSDAGETWIAIGDTNSGGCYSIDISPEETVYATFSLGAVSSFIYSSTNKGLTWMRDSVDFIVTLQNSGVSVFCFDSDGNTYVVGTDGIYKNQKDSSAWFKKSDGMVSTVVTAILVTDNGKLLAHSNFFASVGELYESTDGAESWQKVQPTGLPQWYYFTHLINGDNGKIFGIVDDGFDSGVYASSDEGKSWTKHNSGMPGDSTGDFPYDITSTPDGKIICATSNGVYTYSDVAVSVSDNNSFNLAEYKLQQNYPNPFNPTTTIRYQLPRYGYVLLKVYDAIGREVVTLVNELKDAGTYNVQFDASTLSSGIYFYSLRAGSELIMKKMLLMK